MNIVEMILKALSGDTLKQLASSIGESPESVQKALAAIVPTLLSGVGGLAAKPQGAEKLWSTLRTVDDRVADNLGGVLAGGGADELAKKGTGILEDLLGKGGLAALIGPLSTFLAGNSGLVKKLLPLVAPYLLSFLGKQVKAGNLDLAGLLKLLMSQKSNIANALPAGLAKGLAGVQGLGDLSSFANSATDAVSAAGNKVAAQAADSPSWIIPLLVAVALAATAYWLFNQPKAPVKEGDTAATKDNMLNTGSMPPLISPKDVTDPASGPMDPVVSLSKNFSGFFDSATKTLDSVTDVDTAKAALPELEKLDSQFGNFTALFNKLPEASRAGLTSLLEGGQKTLTDKVEQVVGIPGVGELLKPVLDQILSKVSALLTK